MARCSWNAIGERHFEVGVDRGVLYVDVTDRTPNAPPIIEGDAVLATQEDDELVTESGNLLALEGFFTYTGARGIPWNGLISVTENPDGGQVTPYYIDGIKYLNYVALEEFKATIEAFTYPDEFMLCDGTAVLGQGLFVTQQPKRPFGLTYRTRIGNDVSGVDYAYKIHIVYNATALPTDRANVSISEQIEPSSFSWEIVTKPISTVGYLYKPSAHFVVDTRHTPEPLLRQIEDILYGCKTNDPRLPSVEELIFLFGDFEEHVYDAGTLIEQYFNFIDAGVIPSSQTATIDSGGP